MFYFIPLWLSNTEQGDIFILWDKLGENKIRPGIHNAINLSSSATKKTHHPTILMYTDCTLAC